MTTQEDKSYNGWTNYETWGVALVLDNDEGTQSYVYQRVEELRTDDHHDDEYVKYELVDWLKDFVDELCGLDDSLGVPEPSPMARQLLGGALSDVDWYELASHYVVEES